MLYVTRKCFDLEDQVLVIHCTIVIDYKEMYLRIHKEVYMRPLDITRKISI